jgi:hypothetical protein
MPHFLASKETSLNVGDEFPATTTASAPVHLTAHRSISGDDAPSFCSLDSTRIASENPVKSNSTFRIQHARLMRNTGELFRASIDASRKCPSPEIAMRFVIVTESPHPL